MDSEDIAIADTYLELVAVCPCCGHSQSVSANKNNSCCDICMGKFIYRTEHKNVRSGYWGIGCNEHEDIQNKTNMDGYNGRKII